MQKPADCPFVSSKTSLSLSNIKVLRLLTFWVLCLIHQEYFREDNFLAYWSVYIINLLALVYNYPFFCLSELFFGVLSCSRSPPHSSNHFWHAYWISHCFFSKQMHLYIFICNLLSVMIFPFFLPYYLIHLTRIRLLMWQWHCTLCQHNVITSVRHCHRWLFHIYHHQSFSLQALVTPTQLSSCSTHV